MTAVVVDSSAIVTILLRQAGHAWLAATLEAGPERLMAAPTFVESGMVLESRKAMAAGMLSRTLRDAGIRVVQFDEDLAKRAMHGWRRFGKGNHPAALNLGDCFTYALADHTGYPILCVGNDFVQTDLPVLRPPAS